MKYHIWTEGCQMNVADSRRLASALEQMGYAPTKKPGDADVIVLNTCVVRQSAEDKAIGRLSSLWPLKDKNPEIEIEETQEKIRIPLSALRLLAEILKETSQGRSAGFVQSADERDGRVLWYHASAASQQDRGGGSPRGYHADGSGQRVDLRPVPAPCRGTAGILCRTTDFTQSGREVPRIR